MNKKDFDEHKSQTNINQLQTPLRSVSSNVTPNFLKHQTDPNSFKKRIGIFFF